MINTASFHFRQDKDFPHDVEMYDDDCPGKYVIVTIGGLSKVDYDLCLFMTPEQASQLAESILNVIQGQEGGKDD